MTSDSPGVRSGDFARLMPAGVISEGIWGEWLKQPGRNWVTDRHEYPFPPVTIPPLRIEIRKIPARVLEVVVAEPFRQAIVFRERIPPLKRDLQGDMALHVSVAWQLPEVTLYLNGKLRSRAIRAPR